MSITALCLGLIVVQPAAEPAEAAPVEIDATVGAPSPAAAAVAETDPDVPGEPPAVEVVTPADDVGADAPLIAPAPPPDADVVPGGPRRRGFSRRTWRDLCANPALANDPECKAAPEVGAAFERPPIMRPRSRLATAALGFLAGFGTGFYYAGDPIQGTIFVILDAALLSGVAGWMVALNQLVVRNDIRTGKSLALGERQMGEWETNYYALSWVALLTLVASHLYQGIGGIVAAGRTNDALEGFSVIPLEGGGSVQLSLRW